MHKEKAHQLLQNYRKQQWLQHCSFVLDNFLLPMSMNGHVKSEKTSKRAALVIENRIDKQWLFTVLNSWLMCPLDTELILITDNENSEKAKSILATHAPELKSNIYAAETMVKGTELGDTGSYNKMLKEKEFWINIPYEELLLIQTDALLCKPVSHFFFGFAYLGAPFIPRQHSEYFEERNKNGEIKSFFKSDASLHSVPNRDVFPHLHGNGGLSIRSRKIMIEICERWGNQSPYTEAEDVFFSRHITKASAVAPLEVAQAFACETTYNPNSIGSHAAWKYLTSSQLADHLDKHLRAAWSMVLARREGEGQGHKNEYNINEHTV